MPPTPAPPEDPLRHAGGRIGLISDTHGLLRPEACAFLEGSTLIVHCGDIGGDGILTELGRIAPVVAVRGNNDAGIDAERLPPFRFIQSADVLVLAIHDVADLDLDLRERGVRVVVAGHSHRPGIDQRDGVLFVNPGSAGRRRFKLPVAAAELFVDGADVSARLVNL